jgi:GH15 family glucan-1,4-alpha-glucosidase
VHRHCWDERRGTFLADGDGSGDLDAATLLLGRAGFAGPERVSGTIDAVRRELGAGGPLLWRTTGLRGREGAFLACSFWLVDALAGCGRRDEAEAVFEQTLDCANDVGLLSEEIDPADRSQLGNMPQALSHLSLIRAALALHAQPAVYEARA